MSGIVDKWTSELAKLQNKGRTIFSSGSSPTAQPPEASHVVVHHGAQERSLSSSLGWAQKLNWNLVSYSEASVSMLVECVSP
ncbi:hypothetical protein LguiB_007139 [Lonicera macranthoides]